MSKECDAHNLEYIDGDFGGYQAAYGEEGGGPFAMSKIYVLDAETELFTLPEDFPVKFIRDAIRLYKAGQKNGFGSGVIHTQGEMRRVLGISMKAEP